MASLIRTTRPHSHDALRAADCAMCGVGGSGHVSAPVQRRAEREWAGRARRSVNVLKQSIWTSDLSGWGDSQEPLSAEWEWQLHEQRGVANAAASTSQPEQPRGPWRGGGNGALSNNAAPALPQRHNSGRPAARSRVDHTRSPTGSASPDRRERKRLAANMPQQLPLQFGYVQLFDRHLSPSPHGPTPPSPSALPQPTPPATSKLAVRPPPPCSSPVTCRRGPPRLLFLSLRLGEGGLRGCWVTADGPATDGADGGGAGACPRGGILLVASRFFCSLRLRRRHYTTLSARQCRLCTGLTQTPRW
jgi:hypothetical protein